MFGIRRRYDLPILVRLALADAENVDPQLRTHGSTIAVPASHQNPNEILKKITLVLAILPKMSTTSSLLLYVI